MIPLVKTCEPNVIQNSRGEQGDSYGDVYKPLNKGLRADSILSKDTSLETVRREGQVHFAGEHTSIWHGGWMQRN